MCFSNSCIDNVEADDVIAFLALSKFEHNGHRSTIMSTDKDFLQLVSENTTVYSPTKKKIYLPDTVAHEYGIHPKNYLTYRTIDGDRGDNIDGIKGAGEKKIKTAFPCLSEDRDVTIAELTEYAHQNIKTMPFYKTFLTEHNQKLLNRNYELMQLKESIMPARMQTNILDHADEPVAPLNKFEFSKKFAEDQLWAAFPNHHSWLMETWTLLNSYAVTETSS